MEYQRKTCPAHLKELILFNFGNNCDTLASQLIGGIEIRG